jgi:cell division septum initiation protein DivIVA
VSLEVLLALRRLQEENETLQQENKRLRAMVPEVTVAPEMVDAVAIPEEVQTADSPETTLVEAPAELSRVDVGMSC